MSHSVPEQSIKARIVNPQASTIIGYDSHLPALSTAQLSRDRISIALQGWGTVPPISSGDGNRFANRALRDAAVLIGLVERGNGIHIVLTQRASHLRDHAGQIAFPGGAKDASDSDTWHTAWREAQEEINLNPEHLNCIAQGHSYTTVTAFVVTPWLAWIAPQAQFKAAANEVAQVFELPLAVVMNPTNHQQRSVDTSVGERRFYAMPCLDSQGQERFVWGATAAMLRNVYQTLQANS